MMERNHPKRVEDYTTANLILAFVNMLWIFGVLWSAFGIGAVLLAGAVLNYLILKLRIVRRERQIRSIQRGHSGDLRGQQ